ncbi:MAG: 16S rRNA (uracil(1498)-N(3))-methyltransferase [Negativicutes bacterium]|nr:16S rRNA (uracil(1498)-N(3))-methyltransferase [Negativicutes bacterium]
MRRFFLAGEIADEMTIMGADAHHISRVLRMKPNDRIAVADSYGQAAVARILSLRGDEIILKLEQRIIKNAEPPVKVWLAQGMPKGDKFEQVIQKAVELGATGIIPLDTENTVVRYEGAKAGQKVARWQKIAGEAAKQCGRLIIPEVTGIQTLSSLVNMMDPGTVMLMPYEAEYTQTLDKALRSAVATSFLLIIGPEGGFSPKEAAFCREKGVLTVTLGPRILRTETAALAALSILMHRCGDLGSGALDAADK